MKDVCIYTLCGHSVSHTPVYATRKKGRGNLKGTHLHFWGQVLRGGRVGSSWRALPPHQSTSLLAHTSVLPSHPLRDCIHCLFTATSPNGEQTGLSQCPDREMRLVPGHLISPSPRFPWRPSYAGEDTLGRATSRANSFQLLLPQGTYLKYIIVPLQKM